MIPNLHLNLLPMFPHAIFPLPLVPYEEYMLEEDRRGYPMNVFARLRFSGRLARGAIETALSATLARHPLLDARVQRTGKNRWSWVPSEGLALPLSWFEPGSPSPHHLPGIDLFEERGAKVWVFEETHATCLVLQLHHACCDGPGGLHFLLDLLRAYGQAVGAAVPRNAFRPLDDSKLAERGRFGLSRSEQFQVLRKHLRLLPGIARTVRHRPVPLVPHQPQWQADRPPAGFPATCTRCLESHELAALRAAATRQNVTTNDILIRDLFLALADWQSRHGAYQDPGWRRIWIPVNLRTLAHRWIPAANITSVVFLDRRNEHLADPNRLLESIHRQMEAIKNRRAGLFLPFAMRWLKAITGSVRALVREDRCMATCVLSNLGTALAHAPLPQRAGCILLGEALLEEVELIAPLRPYTCANFCTFEFQKKLWITLHYDPRPLARHQAVDLLETFLRFIRAGI